MSVISFVNEKGGVAKSSTCEAFAASLTERGHRVLTVDLDGQPGNLSSHMGADKSHPGALDLLKLRKASQADVEQCIQGASRFGDLIAASIDLGEIDAVLQTRIGRESYLDRALRHIRFKYDYILIDTPPAFAIRTVNALVASDEIIIPMLADGSSLAGVKSILDALDDVRSVSTHDLRIGGIVLVAWDGRTTLSRSIAGELKALSETTGIKVFDTKIRKAIAVPKAQMEALPVSQWQPTAGVCRDYEALVSEWLADAGR